MTNPAPPWPAPVAQQPVDATVALPGSKSLTNRALLLAALATGPSRIGHPLVARDTALMVDALRALGATIDADGGDWVVTPATFAVGSAHIDCGLAGTVMRFVPPAAALADGPVSFDGDPHARKRPMSTVIDALRALGVQVDDGGRGALPFTVHGRGAVPGGEVILDASASSQFVSGLLLPGARYQHGVQVRHVGGRVPSLPYIAATVEALRDRGVTVDTGTPDTWRVAPGPIQPRDVVIEPDLSNAAPFLAAAVATGGTVHVPRWPARTTQPGHLLLDILTGIGATCVLDESGLTVTGSGKIAGFDLDLADAAELTPVLAALAALADDPSTIRGVGHIRGHETDRLAALATEINGLGGDVSQTADGLAIRPTRLSAGVFHTYDDHRMAQAGAVIGLVVDGVQVENIATTGKTLPQFADLWLEMLDAAVGQDETA